MGGLEQILRQIFLRQQQIELAPGLVLPADTGEEAGVAEAQPAGAGRDFEASLPFRFGFGMFLCELKSTGEAIGSCGLLKRDTLPDPDIGYAFLPEHWGKGYALEAAAAVLQYGHREHRLPRILAITSPDNERSIQVLQKCGMHFQRFIEMAERDQVKLFALEFVG